MRFLPTKYSFCLTTENKLKKECARNNEASINETVVFSEISKDEGQVNYDKRKFLKLAGLGAVGLVASQMLPSKANAYIMGSTPSSNVVGVKDSSNTRVDPAKESTLGGVKTQTDKLTFDGSSNLYVQSGTNFTSQIENSSGSVISPATEDTLALIKTQTNKLTFDVSGNLMTAGGASASTVGVKDATNTQINPATDESVLYLRRIVKLLESQAVVDSGNRQRITLDSLGTGTAITTTVPVSGTVTATVGSTTITSISAGTNVIGGVTIDGQGRQMLADVARQAYNNGIRTNLIFS